MSVLPALDAASVPLVEETLLTATWIEKMKVKRYFVRS